MRNLSSFVCDINRKNEQHGCRHSLLGSTVLLICKKMEQNLILCRRSFTLHCFSILRKTLFTFRHSMQAMICYLNRFVVYFRYLGLLRIYCLIGLRNCLYHGADEIDSFLHQLEKNHQILHSDHGKEKTC